MKYYCLGFLFARDLSTVLLIEKKRPAWQAGKLNGIGGKIEPTETALEAMVREFKEEAGFTVTDWKKFARLTGPDYTVDCFYAVAVDSLNPLDSCTFTDEYLTVVPLPLDDGEPVIRNLHWLVPMALESLSGNKLVATIEYE